jgi:hypothetical protein
MSVAMILRVAKWANNLRLTVDVLIKAKARVAVAVSDRLVTNTRALENNLVTTAAAVMLALEALTHAVDMEVDADTDRLTTACMV